MLKLRKANSTRRRRSMCITVTAVSIRGGFQIINSIANEMPHQTHIRKRHTTKPQEREGITTTRYTPSTSSVAERTVLKPRKANSTRRRRSMCITVTVVAIRGGFQILTSIANEMPHQTHLRKHHTTKSQEPEGITTTRYTPSTSSVADAQC